MFTDSSLYEKSYEEALKHNEEVLSQIQDFKKELEDVHTNLELHQKNLFQNVMVPLGKKALMRGKLVHTNEILVNIGDNWFIKTSAARATEICNRMMKRCNENLKEYDDEMKLLTSNLEVPQEYEVFPTGDIKEIIEPYDEETERLWKERHKENVKIYRKQLAAANQDDDVFEKLNKFEEEEEEEEKQVFKSDTPVTEINEKYNINKYSNSDALISENRAEETQENLTSVKVMTKRVSFSESSNTILDYFPADTTDLDNTNIIYFKHSENNPLSFKDNLNINTPSDIFLKFMNGTKKSCPKSILKNKDKICLDESITQNQPCVSYDVPKNLLQSSLDTNNRKETESPETNADTDEINILGDIIEKPPETLLIVDKNTRPMSKFKKARIARNQLKTT